MMTPAEILDAIQDRIDESEHQCNSGWFMHNDGVVRGLLWVFTGEDPGCYLLSGDSFNLSERVKALRLFLSTVQSPANLQESTEGAQGGQDVGLAGTDSSASPDSLKQEKTED